MATLPKLIPILKSGKINYYIIRKENDFRETSEIVREHKLNCKNSEIKRKSTEQKNKLYNNF